MYSNSDCNKRLTKRSFVATDKHGSFMLATRSLCVSVVDANDWCGGCAYFYYADVLQRDVYNGVRGRNKL